MAVNSYLILEKLKSVFYKKLEKCTTECKIRYVTIYNPQIPMNSNTAYIVVDPSVLPMDDEGERCLLIVLGEVSGERLDRLHHDVICVDEEIGLGKLYENLHEIMEYYNQWEEKMAGVLLASGNLNELCRISVPYFGNPFTIQNPDFEIIGIGETEEIKYPYKYTEPNSDYLLGSWVESALSSNKDIFSCKGPFKFHYIEDHASLLMNIYKKEKFVAQICVDANHRDLVVEDYVRIAILAKYVKQYFKYNSEKIHNPNNRLGMQLKDLFNGTLENNQILLSEFRQMGWKCKDNYVCAIFKPLTQQQVRGTEYLVRKCEEEFEDGVAFAQEKCIYLLINQKDKKRIHDALIKKLNNFIEKHPCDVGVSLCFNEFSEMRDHFLQAKALLNLQTKKKEVGHIFLFDKYKMDCLLQYGLTSMNYLSFWTSGMKELLEHDKENHTDLCMTLKIYLKNGMNVRDTSNELFVHRSTFNYRLQKIKDIIGVDLDNVNERIYLEMLLYKYEETK